MMNWLKRLFGGSDSSTSEPPEAPATPTAPAPPSTPAEPVVEPTASGEGVSDAGDEPA